MELSERSIRIKELISGQVDMGTFGLVGLELIEIQKDIKNQLKKTNTDLEAKNKELVEFLQRMIFDKDMFTYHINEAKELINKNK